MQNNLEFGIIVIGDEILAGRRRDRHFAGIGELIRERGFNVAWLRILPDDPKYLMAELKRTLQENRPVFSCGGIGATPDDHTRACVAEATNVALTPHPEAVRIIEEKFGTDAYPTRIRMAHLPDGSELIPNPYNQIPGFAIHQHYFLPGFPDMAHPMAAWVLDEHYAELSGKQNTQRSVWVKSVPESSLVALMEELTQRFPQQKLFSLPRLGDEYRIELGYRGGTEIDIPFAALLQKLTENGFEFEIEGP